MQLKKVENVTTFKEITSVRGCNESSQKPSISLIADTQHQDTVARKLLHVGQLER
jgi:hypothetical protein